MHPFPAKSYETLEAAGNVIDTSTITIDTEPKIKNSITYGKGSDDAQHQAEYWRFWNRGIWQAWLLHGGKQALVQLLVQSSYELPKIKA